MNNTENIIVFLDTEVFEHENYNFQSRKLLSLRKCKEQGIVNIFITSVNKDEVLKRIEKKIKQAEIEIKSIRRNTIILNNIVKYANAITNKGVFEEYKEILSTEFNTFLKDINATIIPLSNICLEKIMHAYFTDKKPFNIEKKKYEFPDAISISLINEYISDKKERRCIISGDEDIRAFIDTFAIKGLEYFNSLESFLDEVLPNAQVKEYLQEHSDVLEKAVKAKFQEITINLEDDYYDAEEQGRKFIELITHDSSIIDFDAGKVYVQIKADISYEISIAYRDPNGMYWDNEEHDYIQVGDILTKTFSNTETIDLEIECEKKDDAGKEWSIYVVDFSLNVKIDNYI